eukprot:gene4746-biopygen5084
MTSGASPCVRRHIKDASSTTSRAILYGDAAVEISPMNPGCLSGERNASTAHTTSFTQIGGGTVGAGLCADANNVANCGESNVDVQWITSVAPVAPLTYWYDTASDLVAWLTAVADLSNPPLVISISYATPESTVSPTFNQEFNVQALKLVAMGVTIVVASG